MRTRINIVGLSAGWWGCVLGAANGMPWAGILVVVVHLLLHLRFSPNRSQELRVLLAAGLVGLVLDSTLLAFGILTFPSASVIDTISPAWMVALWENFATGLSTSLAFLKGRVILCVVAGALGGPFAYWGGVQLGAIELTYGNLAWIALEWAIALPILYRLAGRDESSINARSIEGAIA